jgi:hypothetical protein
VKNREKTPGGNQSSETGNLKSKLLASFVTFSGDSGESKLFPLIENGINRSNQEVNKGKQQQQQQEEVRDDVGIAHRERETFSFYIFMRFDTWQRAPICFALRVT